MTYTAKHEVGEEVWVMVRNRAVRKTIAGIEIYHSMGCDGELKQPRVTYSVVVDEEGPSRYTGVPEDLAANTKEELLAQL